MNSIENFLMGYNIVLQLLVRVFFDSNIPFVLIFACEELDYCCNNGDETKVPNA